MTVERPEPASADDRGARSANDDAGAPAARDPARARARAPARRRTRCARPISSCARPGRDLRRALEGAGAGRRSCASGSTWNFRRAARTSTEPRAPVRRQTPHRALERPAAPGGLTGGTIPIAGLTATDDRRAGARGTLDGTTQVARLTPSAPVVRGRSRAARAGGRRAPTSVLGVEHILLASTICSSCWRCSSWCAAGGGWSTPSPPSRSRTASRSPRPRSASSTCRGSRSRRSSRSASCSSRRRSFDCMARRRGPTAQRRPGWSRSRFGLLHGLGFAGALSEVGLPAGHIPVALLFFNVGVELGQVAFITAVLALMWLGRWGIGRLSPTALSLATRRPSSAWCRRTRSAAWPCSG